MTADDHGDGDAGYGAGSAPELIASETDEPTTGERLREELERRGAVAWVRRHRLSLSVLGALVLVLGAGTAYVVTRPPAPDPVVRITVQAARDGTGSTLDTDARGRLRATWQYIVSTRVAGDVDTMVGIVGPGLTDPISTISKVAVAQLGVGALGATANCSDTGWWNAKDTDYRARVTRTDTYGRELTADLPLGPPSDAIWHTRVRLACLDTFVRALPPAAATSSVRPGERRADVTLMLTNPTKQDVWVAAADADEDGETWGSRYAQVLASVADLPWRALPAGGTASVQLSLMAYDCTVRTPHVPFDRTRTGALATGRAMPVYVSVAASPSDEQVTGSWVRVDADSVDQVDGQLAALCSQP